MRCLKLLETYWIVDFLFCGLGLLFDKSGHIPGSIFDFIQSLFLFHSYNGAWWYLSTYIIITLCFAPMLYKLSNMINFWVGISVCGLLHITIYLIGRLDLFPEPQTNLFLTNWIFTQIKNISGPLVSFFAGCLLCRYRFVSKLRLFLQKHVQRKYQNILLFVLFVFDFIAINIIHKAALTFFNALVVFTLFNLFEKGKYTKIVFCFLGEHSTAIWLTHMFFYSVLFSGLVQKAKYPIFMLLFMLLLTIVSSYTIRGCILLIEGMSWRIKKCLVKRKH